ncbi:DEAD/DEAH box helicase [Spelaeicoccus albus]|uniref:ATP-dependent RNA helicase HelY n=1 Tax=Spelaeicoccus albus TaxID=1280376 RepID=A0A7Z0IIF7_9MICO|nr:DEAD/DEAH box helicase [Spelaeicoccus albus]NYI68404.1 ATP-dependent RNA helicase HelY [Spelaeicoccus albus]
MSSPAERYAAARKAARARQPEFGKFSRSLGFEPDDFQIDACRSLEAGKSVLVAAPTGAGKTVVAEFAVHLAIGSGRKAFYTTPIKALSNQKYGELCAAYGSDRVGLLTGDVSVNGEAPIVVMTTEVLRNILYASSATLSGLGFVVLDEVHYLADKFRGPVWEEVIIHLPPSVQTVSLSATVSNAEEFGDWLGEVRGETDVIVTEARPVPLFQHVMAGSRLYDLFVDGSVNPQLKQLASVETRPRQQPGHRRSRRERYDLRRGDQGRTRRPSRSAVIKRLDSEALLPAITFIFSRTGCDAAVQQCLRAHVTLTTPEEQRVIKDTIDERCAELPAEDLDVLGFHDFRAGLLSGLAPHHAGMLPTFKQLVEELFVAGLVRAVFATETLSLGINMPARTVVLEKLSKFNGQTHTDITPGEFTQLTGRAGRRGIDVEGHAVVLWGPGMNPKSVAGLASARSYYLRSSFRPTYNMSANLVTQVGREAARGILETSFAQFQADKGVVGLARKVRENESALDGYARAQQCDHGDFAEYAALRRELTDLEKRASSGAASGMKHRLRRSLLDLLPGDIIDIGTGRRAGPSVVVLPGHVSKRGNAQMPTVLTLDGQLRVVRETDAVDPVEPVGRIKVSKHFDVRSPKSRRDLASSLRSALREGRRTPHDLRNRRRTPPRSSADDEAIEALRRRIASHPCHGCSERETHARWAERWWKLRRETDALVRQIEGRTNSIAKVFDRVCGVLERLGYLPGHADALCRIYGERDLLTAESLRAGLWKDLEPAEVAALASTLVYSARREESGMLTRFPTRRLSSAVDGLLGTWAALEAVESDFRVERTAEPDQGIIWPMYKWASGKSLDAVLTGGDLAAGDFVRWAKQVLDLLDQLRGVGDPALRRTAGKAIDVVRRGVVGQALE